VKRLNLNLPDQTAVLLEEQAAFEERTLTEIVRRAIEMYVDERKRTDAPK
jgi:hypothetical protein